MNTRNIHFNENEPTYRRVNWFFFIVFAMVLTILLYFTVGQLAMIALDGHDLPYNLLDHSILKILKGAFWRIFTPGGVGAIIMSLLFTLTIQVFVIRWEPWEP